MRNISSFGIPKSEKAMTKKKSKAGRPKIADGEKKVRLPIAVKKKFHAAVVEKFEAPIKRYADKLDKLNNDK